MSNRRFVISGIILLLFAGISAQAAISPERKAQIEADWLKQLESPGLISTEADAMGAVDGIINGSWNFHTGNDNPPWWHVDLQEVTALDRVVVYNRADGAANRMAYIELWLSDDGQNWRKAYRHDGTTFLGYPDNKPLVIPLKGEESRFVRLQVDGPAFLHLDEVQVYPVTMPDTNIALGKPANQSSASQWSAFHFSPIAAKYDFDVKKIITRALTLCDALDKAGMKTAGARNKLADIETRLTRLPEGEGGETLKTLYLEARWVARELALSNPILDFNSIVFVKRSPSMFSHMSDQNYGWWSRPGGGIFILKNFQNDEPQLVDITPDFPEGNYNGIELSFDGKKILFAYCRYYPEVSSHPDKMHKENLPEDAFYHVFEMNLDGSDLRQLTQGRYDDFSARYLPDGNIVFLSTRRGTAMQCTSQFTMTTLTATLPDSYVRCGGDPSRPVSVYTMHVMTPDGSLIRAISPFENFEWDPNLSNDGRIFFARWDYVDRNNMPYMKLWSSNPDGTNLRKVYGNFTSFFHCAFEARPVPDSNKILMTASAHHAITGGTLVMLDPTVDTEGQDPITKLTPEVPYPEVESWPRTYYANPYPLSENFYLTCWSDQPLIGQGGTPVNGQGVYYYDAFGNLELLYKDETISSAFPLPVKARPLPPVLASSIEMASDDEPQTGRMVLTNVYDGLPENLKGKVKTLRVVGVPAKTRPEPNYPHLGATGDDPGKCVLGTVPVEDDGSAHFSVPSMTNLFFQALDTEGRALQTMRTVTYVQAGQSASCSGCHEPRSTAPVLIRPIATKRGPSNLKLGPKGSWPLRYDQLVQPVLDASCVSCHSTRGDKKPAAGLTLTADVSYDALLNYGSPNSLRDHVLSRYYGGASIPGEGASQVNPLVAKLSGEKGHHGVKLEAEDWQRLYTWIDTYGQFVGSFGEEQEKELIAWRDTLSVILDN